MTSKLIIKSLHEQFVWKSMTAQKFNNDTKELAKESTLSLTEKRARPFLLRIRKERYCIQYFIL